MKNNLKIYGNILGITVLTLIMSPFMMIEKFMNWVTDGQYSHTVDQIQRKYRGNAGKTKLK